ncbi:hypothetical protein D3C78_1385270 [compost metagenome]
MVNQSFYKTVSAFLRGFKALNTFNDRNVLMPGLNQVFACMISAFPVIRDDINNGAIIYLPIQHNDWNALLHNMVNEFIICFTLAH